jgi:hypothetical protein
MYDLKIRYLASAFVDAESIAPNASQAIELSKALGDNYLPLIANEPSPSGPISRLVFRALDNTAQLALLGRRFNYSLQATNPEGSDLGELSDFCAQAKNVLAIALAFFQRKAHRIAAVQEGFLEKMSSQEIEKISLRLFNFPPTYKHVFPFEWDWRIASVIEREFSEIKEETNTITTIKRIPAVALESGAHQPSRTSSDRVRVDFDINTSTTNSVARFGEQQIHGFFDQVHLWHDALSSEVFSFIFGK